MYSGTQLFILSLVTPDGGSCHGSGLRRAFAVLWRGQVVVGKGWTGALLSAISSKPSATPWYRSKGTLSGGIAKASYGVCATT